MIEGYKTKDMKAPKPSGMKAPSNDGEIFERDGLWFFKWKGGECGYASKKLAEEGLAKVSGNS